MSVDASNDFMIGGNGNELGPILPLRCRTREQAFRAAAWLISLGEVLPTEAHEGEEMLTYEEVLKAVRST